LSTRAGLRRSAPDLGRLPIVFNLKALSLAEGVRAGLSVSVIIAASAWLQQPTLLEAALAALLTCLCDSGGPMRRRVVALLSFCVLGALTTAVGGLVRNLGLPAALPYVVAMIFCAGFARVYGQAAQQVGALLCTVAILSIDRALPDLPSAAMLSGTFLAGGLWATLLTTVLWRLHPFQPVRQILSQTYLSLAALVRDLGELLKSATVDEAEWGRHARAHRSAVRASIEAARAVLVETLRARGAVSARGSQSLIRLEAADQLFGALIALSEVLETAGSEDRAVAEHVLRRVRPVLTVLGTAMLTDSTTPNARIARSAAAIAADAERLPPDTPLRRLIDAIVSRLQIANTLTAPADLALGDGAPGQLPALWQRIRAPLLANLNWQSVAFRHALRAAVTAAPAVAFTLIWFTPYDHWLTITITATMQPYFGNTFTRALERVAGTILGGILAAVLGLFVTTPFAIAIMIFPLAVLALAIRAVSLGLFLAALTPMIVLLVELGQPGTSEWVIAGTRALLTLTGGLIAIAGCTFLWPSWEPSRLAAEIRAAIAAHGRFAEAELSALLAETPVGAVEQTRRAAGLASNNVEASISRALLEPGTLTNDLLEAAMVIDAALRRFAGRLVAMQLDPALPAAFAPDIWRRWRDWLGGSMRDLAGGGAAISQPPPVPASPYAESLRRVARQVELIASTLARVRA
jgi:uncharacterized membrane protein YccC